MLNGPGIPVIHEVNAGGADLPQCIIVAVGYAKRRAFGIRVDGPDAGVGQGDQPVFAALAFLPDRQVKIDAVSGVYSA